jgi:hypothetical protein
MKLLTGPPGRERREMTPTPDVFRQSPSAWGVMSYAERLAEYKIDIDAIPEESVEWIIDSSTPST